MENKKFESLLKSNEFMQSIMKMETPEEVQKAFEEKGVNISKEEVLLIGSIVNETIKKGSVLSEPELAKIVGGNDNCIFTEPTNDDDVIDITEEYDKYQTMSNANDENSKLNGLGKNFADPIKSVNAFVLKRRGKFAAISVGALLAAGGAIGIGLEHVTKKFVRWARKK